MAIEIVDFRINSMVDLSSSLSKRWPGRVIIRNISQKILRKKNPGIPRHDPWGINWGLKDLEVEAQERGDLAARICQLCLWQPGFSATEMVIFHQMARICQDEQVWRKILEALFKDF